MTGKRFALQNAAALAFSLLSVAAFGADGASRPETCDAPAPPLVAADPAVGPPGDATAATRAAGAARAALEAGAVAGLPSDLEAARASAEQVGDRATRAHLLIHLGRTAALASERSAPRRALALFAAESFRRAADVAAGVDGRLRAYALGYLAELYEKNARRDEALELARRGLFEAQSAEALDAAYRLQWQIARMERAAGRPDAALASYRQAVRSLAELRAQTAFGTRGTQAAFRSEVAPVYTGFVDLLLSSAARAGAPADERALLLDARGALEELKAAELEDYFRDPCLEAQRRASPEEIPGAVVIYPILLPDRVELIVSRGANVESYTAPVDGETLTAEARTFRRLLEKRTTRQYLRPARNLYDWLIRPIEPALTGDVEALVFVPDGALRAIPFGALHDREKREYLIEQYPVAITPGLTLTEPRPIDRPRVRLLAAGISEAVQGYPALDNVPREIEAVHAAFPGELLMNEKFAVNRFEGELKGEPFGIVHIASHGEFTADVSESFLVAYDGKVPMDRLAAMVSATRFREDQPLELLTLSACQTATGDERAALGLAGIAVQAGARSALATLWSVNDQASSDLVMEFYTQLGSPDVSRAQALQRAQMKLLRMHHYRHAAYWSPFLLINSWL